MYGLEGYEHNVKNIARLAHPYLPRQHGITPSTLRTAYRAFLRNYHETTLIGDDPAQIVTHVEKAETLLSFFGASVLNDLDQEAMVGKVRSDPHSEFCGNQVRAAINELKTADAKLAQLFDMAIHSVALSESRANSKGQTARGGSSNSLIGLIWIVVRRDITTQDVIELLIHEFTHTLVFLDELNFGHFNYKVLALKEFWAQSAILMTARPMDKVVHSVLVATEILHARSVLLGGNNASLVHKDSTTLASGTLAAIHSVLSHPHLDQVCSGRSIQLTERAREHIKNL